MASAATQYTNITADGCCYFGGAYTGISGLSVEGIYATTVPSTTCIQFDQISSAKDIAIINVPTAKCSLGISVIGNSTNIGPVRFPDAGVANQPTTAINYGSTATGLLTSVQMSNCANKIQSGSGGLGNVTAVSCGDIVNRQFTTWTPGYASWSTAPTTLYATYTRIGGQVTINILAQGGACNAGSTITGLPVISSSAAGGGGSAQNTTDTTKGFRCAILSGSTSISGIPVTSFGGSDYWSLTATYFTDLPI